MRTVSPEPQSSDRSPNWLTLAFLDEPEVRSLHAFICQLTATRELHEALRLVSSEVRDLLGARFVAVVVFDDPPPQLSEAIDPMSVVFPMLVAGRKVGQLTAYFDQHRDLLATEAKLMDVVTAVAAVTLDNARHLQREHKRLMQAEIASSLAPRIAAAGSREEMARTVVAALKDRLHYDEGRVLWRDGEHGEIVCLASTWSRGSLLAMGGSWDDSGLALRVLQEGEAVLVADCGEILKAGEAGDRALRSLLAVPIGGTGALLGVIEVGARNPRAFDNADLTTMTSLASQVAVVGERLAGQVLDDGNLRESDHARHDLISLIVHDLRGPLSLIKGYSLTLQRLGAHLPQEKKDSFLSGIDDAADHMAMMLEHVAGVSRLESGRFRPKLRQVDLTQLVTDVVERLSTKLGEHPVSIELPGEILTVQADSEQLARALTNLILNAARLATPVGRIVIRVTAQRSSVEAALLSAGGAGLRPIALEEGFGAVEVRDDGPCIPSSEIRKVFDKFHRLRGTSNRRKSSGLELYMAKKLVEAHSGRIWVESSEGQGNIFGFCLPLSRI